MLALVVNAIFTDLNSGLELSWVSLCLLIKIYQRAEKGEEGTG